MTKRPLSEFLGPRYWLTWLGLGALRLLSLMPLPMAAALGYTVGCLFYVLGSARRNIALRNISACFPELELSEQKRINKEHFMYTGQMLFTGIMNWWCSAKRFNNWVTLTGREQYDQALANNINIILLAPHFIGLEVAGIYLSQERPMSTMYQYNKNELIDEIIKRGRLRFGGELIERKDPMRKLLKLIRKGHPFYYLPDQDAGRKGIFVPFFHELASTVSMLGKFSSMTSATVIPCRTRIKAWGQGYEIVLGAPLENFPTGDDQTDTTLMNKEIEKMVRDCPEQYFWAHKRFKTRPPNAPKFYN